MKGWVYIISNPAMPGLVKVGHSTKDPELRARELNNTGTPHPYTVEYEMLIEDPFRVEQQTHNALRGGPLCLDRMCSSLSGASRYSAYAAVSRGGRLSTYTPFGVCPSSARCGLIWL